MKYRIEKDTVRETLVIPITEEKCVRNCTRIYMRTKRLRA